MKIIQTYWTKPLFIETKDLYGRVKGGWPSMKYALCAMSYSCLSLKKYYNEVELVTDNFGGRLLVDALDLPFTMVDESLNNLDVNTNLWALAKIFTYNKQERPFIHVDNDIFIWGKFPERIEKAPLCCQNVENVTDDYKKGLKLASQYLPDFTMPLTVSSLNYPVIKMLNKGSVKSINAGILGGNDIDFIHQYSECVLNTYNKIEKHLSKLGTNVGLLNIILEQLFFSLKAQTKKVEYLLDGSSFNELVNKLIFISAAPLQTKYVHCLGDIKKFRQIAEQIEFRLKYEYPEYYAKVIKWCLDNGFENEYKKESYEHFANAYALICKYRDARDFMNHVRFSLKGNVSLYEKEGNFHVSLNGKDRQLSGWGKMLFFLGNPITGIQLSEKLYGVLKQEMSYDEIEENVFSYLLQYLYEDSFLKWEI